MKRSLFLLACLLVNHLNAEETKRVPMRTVRIEKTRSFVKVPTVAEAVRYYPTKVITPKTSTTSTTPTEYIRKVSLNVGPGFMLLNGDSYLGGQLGFLVRLSDRTPIYLGVESGAYGIGNENGSEYLIPLAATFLTRFDIHNSAFHPTLGFSVGTVFQHTVDNTVGSTTSNYFLGEVRPGVEIDLAKSVSLTLEPRAGYLKDSFIFHPVIGLSIGL